jgi:ABC-type anion transport system duplicated permease subunit
MRIENSHYIFPDSLSKEKILEQKNKKIRKAKEKLCIGTLQIISGLAMIALSYQMSKRTFSYCRNQERIKDEFLGFLYCRPDTSYFASIGSKTSRRAMGRLINIFLTDGQLITVISTLGYGLYNVYKGLRSSSTSLWNLYKINYPSDNNISIV